LLLVGVAYQGFHRSAAVRRAAVGRNAAGWRRMISSERCDEFIVETVASELSNSSA
jgi:hypothetical protein